MVGHTHEDVDALFGHISTWLRKHDAFTVPGKSRAHGDSNIIPHTNNYLSYILLLLLALLDGLRNANKGSRSCLFSEMFDAKAWLQPHMEQLHNHTNPHIFRFIKGRDGHCYMQWKHWNHNQWEPKEGLGISLLKVNVIRCREKSQDIISVHKVWR